MHGTSVTIVTEREAPRISFRHVSADMVKMGHWSQIKKGNRKVSGDPWYFTALLYVAGIGMWALIVASIWQAFAQGSGCGSKTYCSEMASCAEAHYYMIVCGLEDLDRDNDTIPCEKICGKQISTMNARLKAQPFNIPSDAADGAEAALEQSKMLTLVPTTTAFSCGSKRTCRQMVSCEEATFYLTQCSVSSLDGNGDGVACNGLCR